MKNKLVLTLFSMWLMVMTCEGIAQICGDYSYDPIDFSGPCPPCETTVYNSCLYDFQCETKPCAVGGPNRFYFGPVYYYRRTDFILDDCTQNNVFGFDGNGRGRGQFVGVNLGYELREICCWYFRVDGFLSTGSQRRCIRINDWEGEARIGYTWGECVPAGYAVSPYVGIGYILQNRKYGSVKADYDTWYAPFGVYANVEVMYGFSAGVDVAFAPFFVSSIKARHPTLTFDNRHDSRNRYMWRVSVPMRWKIPCGMGFEVSVEPFWEQYNFGKICAETNSKNEVIRSGIPQFRDNLWGAKLLGAYLF